MKFSLLCAASAVHAHEKRSLSPRFAGERGVVRARWAPFPFAFSLPCEYCPCCGAGARYSVLRYSLPPLLPQHKAAFIYNNMVGRSRRERSVQNSSRLFIRSVVVVELSSVTCMGFVRLSFFSFSFLFLFVYVHTKVFCSLVNTYRRRRRCPRRRWCGGFRVS